MNQPEDSLGDRPFRVGVCVHSSADATMIEEQLFEPGDDVLIGMDANAKLVVPGWIGQSLLLISKGAFLHLEPGMRLHMCNEGGLDRVVGTFEDLVADGMVFPIRINVTMLNVRVRDGISVFVKYLVP
jgi:hypothetical protein